MQIDRQQLQLFPFPVAPGTVNTKKAAPIRSGRGYFPHLNTYRAAQDLLKKQSRNSCEIAGRQGNLDQTKCDWGGFALGGSYYPATCPC